MKKNGLVMLFLLMLSTLTAGCGQKPVSQPEVIGKPPIIPESPINGRWDGTLAIKGAEFAISLNFEASEEGFTGTLDIPGQGVSGLKLSNVRVESKSVHFEMKGGPGLAYFDGELQEDGTIVGEFKQGSISGEFTLKPSEAAAPEGQVDQPAMAEEPLPYLVEEVNFQSGDLTLVGDLTLPPGKGPHPAVILVSGSGPQDRNGANPSVPGYEPSRMLADHLARNGIAALRYDERGVGESSGEQYSATITDLSADVEAAFHYLVSREEIDPEQVGLMGHSEGSLLVVIVAARNPRVAFVISMGGSAVLGYDLMMAQTRKGLEVMGASEGEIAEYVQMAQTEYDQVVAQEWDAIEQQMRETLPGQLEALSEEQRAELGEPEEIIAQEMSRMTTWAYSFLTHNPADDWARINVPVLALFGELDVLVDLEQNRPPLVAALAEAGNDDVTVVVFPKANHLFQQAAKGGPQEWNTLPKEFLPGFLETVSDWLATRVDVQP